VIDESDDFVPLFKNKISVFGRRIALTIAITSWLPCGVLCLLLSITYPSDEDNMKERIKTATDEESAELMAVVEE